MTQTRLDRLSELARKNPGDPFANYGWPWNTGDKIGTRRRSIPSPNRLRSVLTTSLLISSTARYFCRSGDLPRRSSLHSGNRYRPGTGNQHTRDELSQALEQLREG